MIYFFLGTVTRQGIKNINTPQWLSSQHPLQKETIVASSVRLLHCHEVWRELFRVMVLPSDSKLRTWPTMFTRLTLTHIYKDRRVCREGKCNPLSMYDGISDSWRTALCSSWNSSVHPCGWGYTTRPTCLRIDKLLQLQRSQSCSGAELNSFVYYIPV